MILILSFISPIVTFPGTAAFDFMAGSWEQKVGDRTVRETWLPPIGGAMAGAGISYRQGRDPVIEHMKITDEKDGVTFTAILRGQPPTAFRLKSADDGRYVFENLAHDMPQRVIYWPCDKDLCARIEGVVNGEEKSQDWRYRRLP